MRFRHLAPILLVSVLAAMILAACNGQPEQVEVTRLVSQDVPVTVEVTRLVEQVVTVETLVEVPIEVTRIVEVVITASPSPAAPSPSPTAEATATATSTTATAGTIYLVKPGDTLSTIAAQTGVEAAVILAANNLTDANNLIAGQELLIPGWDGGTVAAPSGGDAPAPVITGPNLLPNPSFEEDWYFHIYNELQIPVGWQVTVDEGPNSLQPGSGGLFFRPEIRVVPSWDLPAAERPLFIFEGNKTVKAFKGGAPTSFALFTDLPLQPGRYRLAIRFFADTVVAYEGGSKIWAEDPLAAEARVFAGNGGTGWQGTQIGQPNTAIYDFTVDTAGTVRVGAAFRNRYVMANNSWFLDAWSLHALTTP